MDVVVVVVTLGLLFVRPDAAITRFDLSDCLNKLPINPSCSQARIFVLKRLKNQIVQS